MVVSIVRFDSCGLLAVEIFEITGVSITIYNFVEKERYVVHGVEASLQCVEACRKAMSN
ncbi:hypothetical protein AVEN_75249-1, partial [Araneus ventricosus]